MARRQLRKLPLRAAGSCRSPAPGYPARRSARAIRMASASALPRSVAPSSATLARPSVRTARVGVSPRARATSATSSAARSPAASGVVAAAGQGRQPPLRLDERPGRRQQQFRRGAAERDQRDMVAPDIRFRQQQFARALRLGEARGRGRAAGVDREDQQPVAVLLEAAHPDVVARDQEEAARRGAPPQRLPGGRRAQRRDEVDARRAVQPTGPRRQRASRADCRVGARRRCRRAPTRPPRWPAARASPLAARLWRPPAGCRAAGPSDAGVGRAPVFGGAFSRRRRFVSGVERAARRPPSGRARGRPPPAGRLRWSRRGRPAAADGARGAEREPGGAQAADAKLCGQAGQGGQGGGIRPHTGQQGTGGVQVRRRGDLGAGALGKTVEVEVQRQPFGQGGRERSLRCRRLRPAPRGSARPRSSWRGARRGRPRRARPWAGSAPAARRRSGRGCGPAIRTARVAR